MAILEKEFSQFIYNIRFPLFFVMLMWVAHIYNSVNNSYLNNWGIYPRAIDGLKGILTAPLIHGDFHHLLSNTLPMLMLLSVMSIFYKKVAAISFVIIYLLGGAAVWFFAREVYHIGASGVVYGLVAFVFWTGIFRRNLKSIVLSLIVVILYSGYINGILPNQDGISWESHLFGGIAGIFVAFIFKDVVEDDEIKKDPSWSNDDDDDSNYLSPDTFDKTLQQREREKQLLAQQRGGWSSNSTNLF